jgi:transposase
MSQKYSEEYKRDAVRILRSRGDRTVADIAAQLSVSASQLYKWQAELGDPAVAAAQAEDIEALRRRVRSLEQQNTFLKKACAFFAKETTP